jgi:aldehyde dehydrogenase (NAD+)
MAMSSNIEKIVQTQREYFSTGATLSYEFRRDALCKLEAALKANEQKIYAALHADLGKSDTEAFMCEVGLVQSEITWMKKNLKKLMKRQKVKTPMAQFAANSFRTPSPYGSVLIMSPWNYPVLVSLSPLVAAMAAGNTVVLKPSSYSPATTALIKTMLEETFFPEYICVVTGGRAENQALLHQHFDKIFFTGSTAVGKEVMRCASEHLTPVTLELGGKSPCIVEKTAKIQLAAKRIVFGKFINCGQTCVAPDYILCDQSIRDQLVAAIQQEIRTQFGEHPLENKNYGKIINEKHYHRLLGLINAEKVVWGGGHDEAACRIEPTVMTGVTWDDAVMQEEIFGPILPLLTYEDLEHALAIIESRPRPLALYLYTEDKAVSDRVLTKCRFGGGCINDCIIHLATSEMPFGGVGESGMGGYHGKFGFEEFSHYRSIVDKKTWIDLPVRYQPYTKEKDKLLRNAMK